MPLLTSPVDCLFQAPYPNITHLQARNQNLVLDLALSRRGRGLLQGPQLGTCQMGAMGPGSGPWQGVLWPLLLLLSFPYWTRHPCNCCSGAEGLVASQEERQQHQALPPGVLCLPTG